MSVKKPVAMRVVLHRRADNKTGRKKLHRGSKERKYLYFKGSPTRALADLVTWLGGKKGVVEAVLTQARLDFLTRSELENLLEDESEVVVWRN